MQLHDILLLRTSAILPEAISAGGLTPTTDTSLFLTTYKGGSHLTSDILYDEYNINRHARKVFYPPIATAATYTLHSPAACKHRAASSTVLPVV